MMTVLVADVGGTNTRIALVDAGVPRQMARYQNDRFASFYAVLADYLASHDCPPLQGCCVAVAGPVTSSRAELTNRNWDFDAEQVGATLPQPPERPTRLVNDLVALGYALAHLDDTQLADILPARQPRNNDQSLVAGLGTGVNACLLKSGIVMEAELGHASLPHSVAERLGDAIGAGAAQFQTNECLFSGRGLARLHQVMSGRDLPGPQILAGHDTGDSADAAATVTLMARLLGCFARELVFQYLPLGGVHFAGGAARGILGSSARDDFIGAFVAEDRFSDIIRAVPVRLICDDAAALAGAEHYALGDR